MTCRFLRVISVSLALICTLNGCAQKNTGYAPAYRSVAQKPGAPQTAAQGSPQSYSSTQNVGGSRLDSQPWPAGMGQPYAGQGASAVAPPNPAIPSQISATQQSTGGKVKVAILLPLTGSNAALGQAMQNAAQQAVFDVAGGNFELMPRDSGDSEAGAATAARDAVASGAQLIIGPLFAAQIPAVRAVAQSAHINMLSLSTDTSLAAPGVYVMGFAPAALAERIAHYATARGMKRFAALIPDTSYGQLVSQAFAQAVASDGGAVAVTQSYHGVQDLDAQMRALLAARGQVDAFFLPEGGAELVRVNAALAAAGVDGHSMHLLGTGLWDVPGLAAQNPALVGAVYAAPDAAARRNFVGSYSASYGTAPPRLATLAYDATALAGVLARRGAAFDQASLTNPAGFAGVDGIFRLNPQGIVERGLAVNEITNDGTQVVDPAPASFGGIR